MLPEHEVHDADECGFQLTLAVDQPAQHLLVDHFQELEALLELAEGWELDFRDVLGHADGLDIVFLAVLDLLVVGPAHHADDLVALEEGNVLNGREGTRGTRWSLMKRPSMTFVMQYSLIETLA